MGTVYAEITMKNAFDVGACERGNMNEPEVRQITVAALVDTGAYTLVIGEGHQEKLGLKLRGEDWVKLANGEPAAVKRLDPVEVCWKDRTMTCQPVLLPGTDEVLLGAIPLEDLDLIVDPKHEQLVGRHGDQRIGRV